MVEADERDVDKNGKRLNHSRILIRHLSNPGQVKYMEAFDTAAEEGNYVVRH